MAEMKVRELKPKVVFGKIDEPRFLLSDDLVAQLRAVESERPIRVVENGEVKFQSTAGFVLAHSSPL